MLLNLLTLHSLYSTFLYGHCHRVRRRPRAAPSPRVYLKPCLMSVLAWVGSCSHFRSPSYQNTTGTGEGHPEFKIAKCHWKGSDETCSCTKRSDRWFLLDQRRFRLHSAAVDRTLSSDPILLPPPLPFPSHILFSVVSVSTGAQRCWILSEVEWSGREPRILSVELRSSTRVNM